MKRLFIALTLAAAGASTFAAPNVGVSVNIGYPGVYGRVDVGNAAPVLMYPQPVVVVPGPVVVQQRPIYLRVRPGEEKNWSKNCSRYAACGQRVYFVRDDWYREHYVKPQKHRGNDHDHDHDDDHHGKGKGKHKGHDRDDD